MDLKDLITLLIGHPSQPKLLLGIPDKPKSPFNRGDTQLTQQGCCFILNLNQCEGLFSTFFLLSDETKYLLFFYSVFLCIQSG